jgi:hypothetical protein
MEVSPTVQGAGSIDVVETLVGVQRAAPFEGRPGAGLRSLVRGLLSQLLPPVLKDVREWTVALRLHAARLLYVLTLLAEGACRCHAQAANLLRSGFLARGDRKRPLNDGRILTFRGARVHVSAGLQSWRGGFGGRRETAT